ncbi:MAG: hypothetical protein M3Q07_01970 [Pseudobdellovibrionaceae bacterium]|nr:hypothetical protein [Pseudobdellovibrionaceae bacterium]
MDFLTRRTLCGVLLLISACRSGTESMRGKAHINAVPVKPDEPIENSENAEIQPADPNQAPIVFDNSSVEPLTLAAEADQSGLPAGFFDEIFAVHKVDGNRTILFGKNKQSWLLDESKQGLLTRLTLDITPPTGTSLYVLENRNFWIIGKSSVAFPSTVPSKDPGQLTLINLAPDLLKDSAEAPRVLYAGPQRLILANEKRANIVILEGDKARLIALDFPKMGNTPLPIVAAGLMEGTEAFWFLSAERLLLLKKNEEGRWRWVISKFKVDGGAMPALDASHVAMVLSASTDRSFSYVGRTFEMVGGKLFEQNPIKLSVDIKADPAMDPLFIQGVQPLLKNYCSPCHAGYEEFATLKPKAAAYRRLIADGSMPSNLALTAAQIKTLTDYMTKVMAMP